MLTKLKNHIAQNFPFLEDKKLLLATSGGIDSMVMLHLFQKLNYKINKYTNISSNTMEAKDSKKEKLFITTCSGLIKINKDHNVKTRLKIDEEYYMYLPETSTLLHLKCRGIAIMAADMEILNMIKKGKRIIDFNGCIFSYEFEKFDAVHFKSFDFRETCELYQEESIYTLRHMDALCSVDL